MVNSTASRTRFLPIVPLGLIVPGLLLLGFGATESAHQRGIFLLSSGALLEVLAVGRLILESKKRRKSTVIETVNESAVAHGQEHRGLQLESDPSRLIAIAILIPVGLLGGVILTLKSGVALAPPVVAVIAFVGLALDGLCLLLISRAKRSRQ